MQATNEGSDAYLSVYSSSQSSPALKLSDDPINEFCEVIGGSTLPTSTIVAFKSPIVVKLPMNLGIEDMQPY